MLITDAITYNVRERGRKLRGQDRNFDTTVLANLINGPEVQEKVKHGDMHGYFGHWPRVRFGMQPPEGGIVDGKVVAISPALRTVELSARPDGTITHRAEFLDSNEGRVAARLYESKTGGFSSAIDAKPGTNPQIPFGFYGFDYVLEPNYSTNRGHKVVLDGVHAGDDATELIAMLDAVIGESTQAAGLINRMFDALHAQHMMALQTLDAVSKENDMLIGRLAAKGVTVDRVLDAVSDGLRGVTPDYAKYKNVELAGLQELNGIPAPVSPELTAVAARYGFKL